MKNVQIINVAPSIPAPLRFLETLARNAWWSWSQEAQNLFRRIDPVVWKASNENPLQFLREVPQATLESPSHDLGLLSQLARLEETFAECTARDLRLMFVRLKPRALTALQRATDATLQPEMLHELSVDECVQSLGAGAPAKS